MRDLPIAARLYVAAVVVAGAVLVVVHAIDLPLQDWLIVVPLASLTAFAHRFRSSLRQGAMPRQKIDISVTQPVAMASVILLGPVGAPLVGCAMAFAPGAAWIKRLFNGGMGAIQSWVAAMAYVAVGGSVPLQAQNFEALTTLKAVAVAILVMEVVNGLLLMALMFLIEGASPVRVWFGTMAESALPMFIYSIFGLLLAVVWSYVGVISAVLVLAPLMVARWVFAQFSARQDAYEATIRSLIQAVEMKDSYTRGHSERVSRASVLIGRTAGMREDRVESLRYAGMLHDVGKLGVPTTVLQKAGKLTEAEFESIQQHPARGREITKDLEFLGEAIEGIHLHHERIDGRGYPLGLKGSEIPEFARIIAVADAFDSMTTTRSYRGARTIDDAVHELRRCKGSQFDPVMVECLVEAIDAQGWDASDTIPTDLPSPHADAPAFGSDDDDPTAAAELGLGVPTAVPDDASELDDAASEPSEERS